MPPRRGRGRRGATEPEDRVDRIERILEGLVQVVHEVHNNNNHDDAPQQPAMPMPGAGAMPLSTESRKARRFEAGLRWNIKNKVEILRLPTHQEVLHAALIAEESLKEMSQFRENRKKRIGGNMNRGQSSKRQSSGSSSGNSSAQQRKIASQGSSGFNELPTCPICQKKHRGECRMGTRACYGCGQEGHQIRDCPMRNRIQGAGTSTSASVPSRRLQLKGGIISRDKVELLHLCQGIPPLPHQLCQVYFFPFVINLHTYLWIQAPRIHLYQILLNVI
ncbi:hypothetical protein Acr_02g0009790 [Actinidia rufa]|uniref:CCHC-type domain-containing protein n=1 Tax=Actinidia rufa TaxID=165716 RepID=A0A7J0E9Y9_9ERIC|nr:hypothetical protein Acr_02g0009790 [Actinidia rufa]